MNITKKDIAEYKLDILQFDACITATKMSPLLFITEIIFLIVNNFPIKEYIPHLILGNVLLILAIVWAAITGFKAAINMLMFEYYVFGLTEAKMELTSIMEKFGLTDEQIEEILNYDKN